MSKKQGYGVPYGKIRELDSRIVNHYHNAETKQRYMTISTEGKVKFFPNLTRARVDVIENFTSRSVIPRGWRKSR